MSEFVIVLGLILIPVAVSFLSYLTLTNWPAMRDELNGIVGPIVAIFLVSYFTTKIFNEVYSMAISTVLQCYVADEEMFEPADRFAEGPLKATISKTNQVGKVGRLGVEIEWGWEGALGGYTPTQP